MSQTSILLKIPVEVRLRVYDHMFMNQHVIVQPEHPDRVGEGESSRMKAVPMSAQLIRTCQQLHEEAHTCLYASNIFNCSQREAMKLLLQNIGPKNLPLVKHIIIDWEQLEDFSWSLAKSDFRQATQNLQVVELANWRRRILGDTSFLGRSTKSYERQLVQSAVDICRKHANLKIVAQQAQHRPGRAGRESLGTRVKWRFVTCIEDLHLDETTVDVELQLQQLSSGNPDADRTPNLIIDAF